MRKANVFVNEILAGELQEIKKGKEYIFCYLEGYEGDPVSLEMPILQRIYQFDRFPPFFEGLLPEGIMLEGLLKQAKIDLELIIVGKNRVDNVTVEEAL